MLRPNEISVRIFISVFVTSFTFRGMSQDGGNRAFRFMDVPHNPGITALGGVNVSLSDGNGNMFLSNPALITATDDGQVSFNHYFYYAGISHNSFSFIYDHDKAGTWGLGLQQAGYGTIKSYDPSGNSMGEVRAGEYALSVGNSHTAGNFTIGGSVKMVVSDIATYRASALMFDLGGVFRHPSQDLSVGLDIHNLGFVLRDYTSTSRSVVPFDVRAGVSFKPPHMPFRFSMTIHRMTESGLPYYSDAMAGITEEPGGFDRIFSHFVMGTELIINKNLSFSGGYNHLIRQELRLQNVSGGAGFSYGFLLKIKTFSFSYSGAVYHVAGVTHHLGLSVNLSKLYHRKS